MQTRYFLSLVGFAISGAAVGGIIAIVVGGFFPNPWPFYQLLAMGGLIGAVRKEG